MSHFREKLSLPPEKLLCNCEGAEAWEVNWSLGMCE